MKRDLRQRSRISANITANNGFAGTGAINAWPAGGPTLSDHTAGGNGSTGIQAAARMLITGSTAS